MIVVPITLIFLVKSVGMYLAFFVIFHLISVLPTLIIIAPTKNLKINNTQIVGTGQALQETATLFWSTIHFMMFSVLEGQLIMI